ncbi:MAG TPA: YncE family protein [Gammaproteobacteria bacterium]|nr:YncE family protein [Gammaproteobacteria bacterium]
MRPPILRNATLLLLAALLLPVARAQSPDPLKQIATIALPNVAGRIDHLAFDAQHQRLFVAALGNDTVEVLDTTRNAHLKSLPGFHEPQGIAVASDFGAVAVANGDTGTLQLLDAETFATRWTVEVGGDADNVRYDAAAKQLYVAAVGGLYRVDPESRKVTKAIAIDGHPESFQLEAGGNRVYANLPGVVSSQVVVGDREAGTVVARWSSLGCRSNYPMALDEMTMRVFIGCRSPARLAALDSRSGNVATSVEIVGDTDDLFSDAARQRIYVIGGEGFVDVLQRRGETIERAGRVGTRAGARTGLWVAATSRLYVSVPARDTQGAEVRVFEAQ